VSFAERPEDPADAHTARVELCLQSDYRVRSSRESAERLAQFPAIATHAPPLWAVLSAWLGSLQSFVLLTARQIALQLRCGAWTCAHHEMQSSSTSSFSAGSARLRALAPQLQE
jgi:hypothetical protein